MKKALILILAFASLPLQAAELFGVQLLNADRNTLRNAVKNAGVRLVSEAGNDAFFDVYESDGILHDSNFLYLGFTKQDNKFAFAEYEFNGLKQPLMLANLKQRYGKPVASAGKFITDRAYNWQSNGVAISLYADWKAYKTRLIYYDPAELNRLREQQKAYVIAQQNQQKRYLPQGY